MKNVAVKETSAGISFIPVMRAAAFSLAVTFGLFFVLALVLYLTDISEGIISQSVFAICIISLVIGGIAVSRKIESSGFLHGALVALCYFMVVFIGSAIANKGLVFNMKMFTLFLGCIAAGMFGGIIGMNIKPRSRRW